MDDLAKDAPGKSIIYSGAATKLTERLISDEFEILNSDFLLPEVLKVEVGTCDEPNAFYDPQTVPSQSALNLNPICANSRT